MVLLLLDTLTAVLLLLLTLTLVLLLLTDTAVLLLLRETAVLLLTLTAVLLELDDDCSSSVTLIQAAMASLVAPVPTVGL